MYSPPCWLPAETQNDMINCSNAVGVYVYGYALWENTASRKEGFQELTRFCRYLEDRGVCKLGFDAVAAIWDDFKTRSPTLQIKNLYDPFSDAIVCQECNVRIFEGKYCDKCINLQHKQVVLSVFNFVFKEV